jgi:hypothetical protein
MTQPPSPLSVWTVMPSLRSQDKKSATLGDVHGQNPALQALLRHERFNLLLRHERFFRLDQNRARSDVVDMHVVAVRFPRCSVR